MAFTMPRGAVTMSIDVNEIPNTAALAFSPDGSAVPAKLGTGPLLDPLAYGTAPPVEKVTHDRAYKIVLDDGFGFAQGSFNYVSNSMNGRLYPAGWLRENASRSASSRHLHGHRVRVLSRNGTPATGSTWWTDSLNVAPGEIFEIGFTANNPGIWMDHCHNFKHGAEGMIMHLAYTGITSPFDETHIPE